MSEDSFYVEKIIEARLDAKGTGRNGKRFWWAGYAPDKATWEPAENFEGSKYAITNFWKNADVTGGRNHEQLSKFDDNEVIKLKPPSKKPASKPGPGRSSAGFTLGTRVFALWAEDQHYYSAVVQRRAGFNYVVRFDEDNLEITLPLKDMRACADLRTGDTIILKNTEDVGVSEIQDSGSIIVKTRADCSSIKISRYDIEQEWGKRQLRPSQVVCASKY
ncbi:hypothetical protein C8R46DRAFT_1302036 [Mycena filopes]|nr:hypothetical protein C8R46DRAFT_1302036 [Mycena filopes]